eukprot:227936_1
MLEDHRKKPGTKGPAPKSYLVSMTHSEKLDFIDTVEEQLLQSETDVIFWVAAAELTWGKQTINTEYPDAKKKDGMVKILKRWWEWREEIKAAFLCGLAAETHFRSGGAQAANPYENLM